HVAGVSGTVLQTLARKGDHIRPAGHGIEEGIGRKIDAPLLVDTADPADRSGCDNGLERIEWQAVRLLGCGEQDEILEFRYQLAAKLAKIGKVREGFSPLPCRQQGRSGGNGLPVASRSRCRDDKSGATHFASASSSAIC